MSEVDTALSKDKAAVSSLNPLATEASTLEKGTRDGEVGALIASPLAWPKWKKLYHLSIAASFAFVITIGDSIYISAVPSIMRDFGISETAALLPYSFYAFGQALGPTIAAPISETFGRRTTYVPYIIMFMLFTMGAGFSNDITSLTVCRFFAGLTGSPCLSVGFGTVADIYALQERAIPTAVMVVTPFLGPSIAPVIGSNLVETESWRWTQWFLIFLTLLVSLWAVGMRETYEKVLIDRQQKAAGIDGDGNKGPSTSEKLKLLLTATLFRPWRMFFTEPIVGSFALLSGFDTAIYYALFAFFPYIYTKVYHFNLRSQDLTFLGLAVGNIVGFLCMVGLSRIAARRTMKAIKAGETPTSTPEMRLAPALLGSIFVPGGIFWMAWSSRSSVHFIMPIIGSAIFSFGNYLVFMGYAIYMIDVYKARVGASATAAVAMLRNLLGGAFPLFTIKMYDNLGIAWATSTYAFIALALSTVPWLLRRFGPALRERSKYT